MDAKELKPCPFCGGPVELERCRPTHDKLHGERNWWGVKCRNTINRGGTCAIEQVPSASEDAAIERWNRRAALPSDAPQAMLTDEQILNAFELSGVEFQEVYSTTLKKWLPLTKGTQNANRLISAVRALIGAQATRTPIYQIGANAGGGIAWWDVDKDRYEREKKAGFMKTGIVYREKS